MQVNWVEPGEQVTHGRDLVAGIDRDPPQHHTGTVVEGSDQMRRIAVLGACTADGLAIDGDHPRPATLRVRVQASTPSWRSSATTSRRANNLRKSGAMVVVVVYILGDTGRALQSAAVVGDGTQTLLCAYLSARCCLAGCCSTPRSAGAGPTLPSRVDAPVAQALLRCRLCGSVAAVPVIR